MSRPDWDERFSFGSTGQQQLPPQPKIKALNGSMIKPAVVTVAKKKAEFSVKRLPVVLPAPEVKTMLSLNIDVSALSDAWKSFDVVMESARNISRGSDSEMESIFGGEASSVYSLMRLNEVLGRGSSAVVYKAIILDSMIVCAEKVVVVSDPSKRSQLVHELKALKAAVNGDVKCPYIVRLFDVVPNPVDGTLSVCLEYMDGGSLQDIVLNGGCANEKILRHISWQTLNGLSFLHSKRIIHRDVKPSNALISSFGVVKLADFGLAKTLESGHSLADSFVGTFNYMAPERMTGNSYSFESDTWALGLTIHAVAVGRYPYDTDNTYWALLTAIQEHPTPLPPSSQFSVQFIDLISQACAHSPEQRPAVIQLLAHPFFGPNPMTTKDSTVKVGRATPQDSVGVGVMEEGISIKAKDDNKLNLATQDSAAAIMRNEEINLTQHIGPVGQVGLGQQLTVESPKKSPTSAHNSSGYSHAKDSSAQEIKWTANLPKLPIKSIKENMPFVEKSSSSQSIVHSNPKQVSSITHPIASALSDRKDSSAYPSSSARGIASGRKDPQLTSRRQGQGRSLAQPPGAGHLAHAAELKTATGLTGANTSRRQGDHRETVESRRRTGVGDQKDVAVATSRHHDTISGDGNDSLVGAATAAASFNARRHPTTSLSERTDRQEKIWVLPTQALPAVDLANGTSQTQSSALRGQDPSRSQRTVTGTTKLRSGSVNSSVHLVKAARSAVSAVEKGIATARDSTTTSATSVAAVTKTATEADAAEAKEGGDGPDKDRSGNQQDRRRRMRGAGTVGLGAVGGKNAAVGGSAAALVTARRRNSGAGTVAGADSVAGTGTGAGAGTGGATARSRAVAGGAIDSAETVAAAAAAAVAAASAVTSTSASPVFALHTHRRTALSFQPKLDSHKSPGGQQPSLSPSRSSQQPAKISQSRAAHNNDQPFEPSNAAAAAIATVCSISQQSSAKVVAGNVTARGGGGNVAARGGGGGNVTARGGGGNVTARGGGGNVTARGGGGGGGSTSRLTSRTSGGASPSRVPTDFNATKRSNASPANPAAASSSHLRVGLSPSRMVASLQKHGSEGQIRSIKNQQQSKNEEEEEEQVLASPQLQTPGFKAAKASEIKLSPKSHSSFAEFSSTKGIAKSYSNDSLLSPIVKSHSDDSLLSPIAKSDGNDSLLRSPSQLSKRPANGTLLSPAVGVSGVSRISFPKRETYRADEDEIAAALARASLDSMGATGDGDVAVKRPVQALIGLAKMAGIAYIGEDMEWLSCKDNIPIAGMANTCTEGDVTSRKTSRHASEAANGDMLVGSSIGLDDMMEADMISDNIVHEIATTWAKYVLASIAEELRHPPESLRLSLRGGELFRDGEESASAADAIGPLRDMVGGGSSAAGGLYTVSSFAKMATIVQTNTETDAQAYLPSTGSAEAERVIDLIEPQESIPSFGGSARSEADSIGRRRGDEMVDVDVRTTAYNTVYDPLVSITATCRHHSSRSQSQSQSDAALGNYHRLLHGDEENVTERSDGARDEEASLFNGDDNRNGRLIEKDSLSESFVEDLFSTFEKMFTSSRVASLSKHLRCRQEVFQASFSTAVRSLRAAVVRRIVSGHPSFAASAAVHSSDARQGAAETIHTLESDKHRDEVDDSRGSDSDSDSDISDGGLSDDSIESGSEVSDTHIAGHDDAPKSIRTSTSRQGESMQSRLHLALHLEQQHSLLHSMSYDEDEFYEDDCDYPDEDEGGGRSICSGRSSSVDDCDGGSIAEEAGIPWCDIEEHEAEGGRNGVSVASMGHPPALASGSQPKKSCGESSDAENGYELGASFKLHPTEPMPKKTGRCEIIAAKNGESSEDLETSFADEDDCDPLGISEGKYSMVFDGTDLINYSHNSDSLFTATSSSIVSCSSVSALPPASSDAKAQSAKVHAAPLADIAGGTSIVALKKVLEEADRKKGLRDEERGGFIEKGVGFIEKEWGADKSCSYEDEQFEDCDEIS